MTAETVAFGAEVNKRDDGGILLEPLLAADSKVGVEIVLAAPQLDLDLNLEAAATRPPCSLQAVHSCRKYSGATQVPQPRFLQKTSENI